MKLLKIDFDKYHFEGKRLGVGFMHPYAVLNTHGIKGPAKDDSMCRVKILLLDIHTSHQK